MAKRQGTNILMGYIDSSDTFIQFACAKSCEYELTRDMQEVSSPTTGQAKEYIPMRYGWTMSCSCLLCNDNSTLENAFLNGTALTMQWQDATSGSVSVVREALTGTAYIKTLKASAQLHQMATFSISLQGSGTITRTEINEGDQ